MKTDSITDKALTKFAELVIGRMESLSKDWQQPWINSKIYGSPQNLSGRLYSRSNALILHLLCAEKNYEIPIFLTFLQAKNEGISIKKDEKSFPALFYSFTVKDDITKQKISFDDYKLLSVEEKERYTVTPFLKVHNVFNLQQTTFPEVLPERWEELKSKYVINNLYDEKNMIASPKLDSLVANQAWVCPIYSDRSNQAYFIPSKDEIHLPLKAQFKTGEMFYSTLLHEMAHSTGVESRLNRDMSGNFLNRQYGKEELVAELTAALMSRELGVTTQIQENNVAYLKGWTEAIKEDPKFLYTILSDAGKAGNMIKEVIDKNELSQSQLKDAALKNDFVSVLQLKEQGVKLTPSGLKNLEVSGVSGNTMVAIQKIFGVSGQVNTFHNTHPVQKSAETDVNQQLKL